MRIQSQINFPAPKKLQSIHKRRDCGAVIPQFGCVKFFFDSQRQRIIKELSGAVKCRVYGAAIHEFGYIKLFFDAWRCQELWKALERDETI